jgi:enoyl-CoA hydratase
VRCIVLTGAGDKAFCAGADLSDVGGMTPASVSNLAREGHWLCIGMEKMGKPIVAAVNGHALGGGLELTLPCDFRVAAKRATFGLPEVTIGLLPAMGGTQRLPKLIGLSRAKEIALIGNRLDAQTAHAWGLVHRVFENESFLKDAQAFAAEIATRAPISLKKTKQLLNAAHDMNILSGMEAEATAFGVLASTEDMLEGVSSMFAKKKPEFQGR